MSLALSPAPLGLSSTGHRLVQVCNPVGLEPKDYLVERLHHLADHARYLLHRIHYATVFHLRDENGFVPLKAEYLRPYFPDSKAYKQVRDGLIESGAIVCDRHYIPGEKSLGYKLGEELSTMRQHTVIIANRILVSKILTNRQEWIKAPEGVHQHLLRCLRAVEIDFPAALDCLLEGDFEPSDETAIQMIRDREFFFHVCDYGRVHTNLTNLRSKLRSFLSHGGSPLVNLDIRNSQPLIFSILLREHYEGQAIPPDVQQYVDLVQEGRFYEHLMSEGGIPVERRGKFKRQFFGHVFFCKNRPVTDAARIFDRQFPNVYSAIWAMKEDDYTALAKNLQRAESDLMISRVAERCMNELPHAFIATIHDSILTTPDQAETILAIMREEFGQIGLKPTIRVEHPRRPEKVC
jgi:hypothetical protein